MPVETPPARAAPPSFLRLAGHPVRWRLLSELSYSDRRVGELCARLGLPQSLVSYHLGRRRSRTRVLFLCTGNSARSQIAEALTERLGGGAVEAFSAGSHPKPVHPNAVRVLSRRGIDITGRRSKHLDEFADVRFDYVVSLCDRVREVCPEFPGRPDLIHWSVPDPGREGNTNRETYPAFERTAAELATRVAFLLERIEHAQS